MAGASGVSMRSINRPGWATAGSWTSTLRPRPAGIGAARAGSKRWCGASQVDAVALLGQDAVGKRISLSESQTDPRVVAEILIASARAYPPEAQLRQLQVEIRSTTNHTVGMAQDILGYHR